MEVNAGGRVWLQVAPPASVFAKGGGLLWPSDQLLLLQ